MTRTDATVVRRQARPAGNGIVARPARRRMLVLLVALPVIFLGYGLAGWSRGWALGVDSSVYRAGAVLLLHGHSPYDVSDLGYLHLSFTYPPAAALLFTPLAALPVQLAWAVMASASALALALVIRVAIAAVPCWRFPAAGSTLLLTVAMLCLVPVWRTTGLGQVNVLLTAMVAVDVLVVTGRGSRCGGLLTGVAAAVKLVPLIFIPHLFLTGKRAVAARALAVFAGLQGLTLLIAPQDSAYWTSYVFQTGPDRPRAAPVSWLPCWVWIAPVVVALASWLQDTWRGAGQRRAARWERWAGAGAVIGVIAMFTSRLPAT